MSNPLPQTLFKYRRADRFALELLAGRVYFAAPTKLNDPTDLQMDQAADLQFRQHVDYLKNEIEATDNCVAELEEEIRSLPGQVQRAALARIADARRLASHLSDDEIPDESWLDIAEKRQEEIVREVEAKSIPLRKALERYRAKFHQLNQELAELESAWKTAAGLRRSRTSRRMGVLCTSTERDVYLMWAFYADGFRGLAVGFSRDRLASAFVALGLDVVGPLRVSYRDLRIEHLIDAKFQKRQEGLFAFKPKSWAYEREVRFVRRDAHGVVQVPTSAVTDLIVGNRMAPAFRRKLIETLRELARNASPEHGPPFISVASADASSQVHLKDDEELEECVAAEWQARRETSIRAKEENDELPF